MKATLNANHQLAAVREIRAWLDEVEKGHAYVARVLTDPMQRLVEFSLYLAPWKPECTNDYGGPPRHP